MIRRPPRSTLFPTRRSSDLNSERVSESGVEASGIERQTTDASRETKWNELNQERKKWKNKEDRKSTRLNSSHMSISYAVFCLKKKKKKKKKKNTNKK